MTDTAPPTATPACTRLAEGLQDLRTRTGLSLTALAERTPYSKSSWARYLNGKQLAPREAVKALCAMAGEPPGRLVTLWELAELEWSGRHRTSAAAPPLNDQPSNGGTSAGRLANGWSTRPRRWALAAAACAVALATATWVTTSRDTDAKDTAGQTAPSALPAPGCRAQKCAGEDPEMMGCAAPGQAQRLGLPYQTRTGARLSVTFSRQCHTAWALAWNTHIGDVLEVSVPGRRPERVKVADTLEAGEPLFTPMIDGSDLTGLQACFKPADGRPTECVAAQG
ncbi:helix-turn-helix domain-containing protein [Streptomyces mirabilis]|uniref:helix-turn-helix domain-containing protein n=1 Tax=Streptomyces mirabilis TaxID=68239 RepID=UPI0036831CF1